ncbi:MAG TPA: hypothetical protein VJL35_09095 [Gemmatimonadaceae bacterium]|jgi:hypothetical protein|nr:hypothetical protein [Gemmatimonadaceae bacterium]
MKFLRYCILSMMIAGAASGQSRQVGEAAPRSPILDMIERAKNSLNNLQYTQARTASREILALRLKRSQEIAALQVAAASYFPDEPSVRMPDSAAFYLRRLVRVMPVGALPADLVSPGLDSQLVATRKAVFGATARAPAALTLKGIERRPSIEVMSTRPARWQMYLISGDGGPPILIDTLAATSSGRLSLQAHNGVTPLVQPGADQIRILSISASEPDTIVIRFDANATGVIPTLADMPAALSSAKLLPEKAPRALGAGIAAAIVGGSASWALANVLMPPKNLGDQPKDSRGLSVGIGVAAIALAAGILDHGRPIPKNIKANAATRSDHLKMVGDVTETNRKRVSEFAVEMTIDPEIK